MADPNLWAPFPGGGSFAQWLDDAKTQASLDAMGLSQHDIDGYWAYEHIFDEMRQRLRTRGPRHLDRRHPLRGKRSKRCSATTSG